MEKALIDKIRTISTPKEMMSFLDSIVYGCIHIDGTRYVDSLGGHNFKEKYRTLSLEDSFKNRIGACFEQANISKYIYEVLGISHKTVCTREFNAAHLYPDDLYLVHCYVLGCWDDAVINVEHSDSEKRGIYVYNSMEEAIKETDKIFSKKFKRNGATETRVDEYCGYIPGGLTFLEVNQFVKDNIVAR